MDSSFHFLSGSFRSLSLYLLAFSPVHRTITHVQTIPAFGPHQYLATNHRKDRIFATTWAQPPSLSSWSLERGDVWHITHLNTVPISGVPIAGSRGSPAATSSYINIPPPFTHIYSVGGPTGEVHPVDPHTGGFGAKSQEILFVPEDQLPEADKTRVALRYGSHGIESTSTPSYSLTFVPVLGTNTIEVYTRDPTSGNLTHLSSSPSPRGPEAHDGPRHVKVHPSGKVLYCVTEHSNFVDLYDITPTSLTYRSSRSLLPDHLQSPSKQFRGDTLLLTPSTPSHPNPYALVTTTRGATPSTRGWLSIFAIDENGYFPADGHVTQSVVRYETATSGGKANAIDLLPRYSLPSRPAADDADPIHMQAQVYLDDLSNGTTNKVSETGGLGDEQGLWILLTDDDETVAASPSASTGGVKVLEWDGWGGMGVSVVAEWPELSESGQGERMMGGSHAIWLV